LLPWKGISITCSECVSVASVIQHSMHMGRVMSSYLTCPTTHFSTLSHKRHDFGKKICWT